MSCLPCFGSKEESNEQEILPVAQAKGHPSSQSTGIYIYMYITLLIQTYACSTNYIGFHNNVRKIKDYYLIWLEFINHS